jgi:enamine deaminase RidA (YjgF/YER057c/UK114 family)
MGQEIQPREIPRPETYALGQKVGNQLWIAGQTPVGDDGQTVGLGDARAQAECVYRRIGLILKEAGGKPSDIVMIRTYLTDLRYMPVVRDIRAAFLQGHRPASTTVQVVALVQPEWLIEVDVVAVLGQS